GSNSSRSSGSLSTRSFSTFPPLGSMCATNAAASFPGSASITTPKSPSQPFPASTDSGSAFNSAMAASAHSLDGNTGTWKDLPSPAPAPEDPLQAGEQPAGSLGLVRRGLIRRLAPRDVHLQRLLQR